MRRGPVDLGVGRRTCMNTLSYTSSHPSSTTPRASYLFCNGSWENKRAPFTAPCSTSFLPLLSTPPDAACIWMQIRHQTCLSHVHARPACAYQQGQSTTDVLHSRTPRCFTVPPPLPEADHHLRDYHQAHPTIQGRRPSLQASRSDCSQPTGGARVPSHVPTTKPYLRPSPMPLVSF